MRRTLFNTMSARTRRIRRGFTLIEVVIATLMMAMVIAACFASLGVAYKAKRSVDDAMQPVRSAQIALAKLNGDVLSIMAPSGTLAGPFLGSNDTGDAGYDADVVSFHTQTLKGMRKIELAVETSDDLMNERDAKSERRWVLVRRVWDNLLAPIVEDPQTQVIARGVRGLNVTYFDGADWLDEWDSTLTDNQLPQAIRITLTMQEAGRTKQDSTQRSRSDVQEQGPDEVTREFSLPCAQPPAGGRVSG